MIGRAAIGGGVAIAFALAGAGVAWAAGARAEYHADAARTGRFSVPGLSEAKVRGMAPQPAFRAPLDGPVYAAPLYIRSGGRAMLIVATEQNAVLALDAASGEQIWRTVLGPPVPSSALPCGDIEPMGITGTPAIDAGKVFVAAMLRPEGKAPRQTVFALALADGRVEPGWPVDVGHALAEEGREFIAANQGQRSALTASGGRVFVSYAGHFGDCRLYHGWVVGIDAAAAKVVSSFETRARGGGIWAPGGMISDGEEYFFATGNTMNRARWGGGEAVIRLSPDGAFSGRPADFFAPRNWRQLDAEDLDLGATSPMLVGKNYVLALGKDGKAYLLDRKNLGGIGGQVAERRVSSVPIRTAPASFESGGATFVVFQGEGVGCPGGKRGDLVALRIGPGKEMSVAWCAEEGGLGAPVVTTDAAGAEPVVWAVGAEGDERLRAFRGSDGALLFTSRRLGLVRRFETPVVGGGRIYVAADSAVYGFGF